MLFFFGFPGKFAISAELPQPAESLLLAARAAQSLWLQFPVFCASDRFLTFHGASDHPKPEKGPPTMLPLLQIDHPEAEQPDHDQHRKIRVRLRNLGIVVSYQESILSTQKNSSISIVSTNYFSMLTSK